MVSIEKGWIRIEQRNWRGNIDSPKTERSKRTLTLGSLADRIEAWIDSLENNRSDAWVFPQHDTQKPMWDSDVRAALKEAAVKKGAISLVSGCTFCAGRTSPGGKKWAVPALKSLGLPVMPAPR